VKVTLGAAMGDVVDSAVMRELLEEKKEGGP
jgi:hypothetical protein